MAAHQALPSLGFSRQEHWSACHCLLQCMKVKSLSRVWLLATPWTAAHQAPPSMGFSRQEYWSGCHCLLWKEYIDPCKSGRMNKGERGRRRSETGPRTQRVGGWSRARFPPGGQLVGTEGKTLRLSESEAVDPWMERDPQNLCLGPTYSGLGDKSARVHGGRELESTPREGGTLRWGCLWRRARCPFVHRSTIYNAVDATWMAISRGMGKDTMEF